MDTYAVAKKVSIVTIAVNLLLGIFKILAGFIGMSTAMIADGFHTMSDVVTTILVFIGIRIASKQPDEKHPYGHEKFEPVFAKLVSIFLAFTGFTIGYEGIKILVGRDFSTPTTIALVAAALSIVVKEGMYWYTLRSAKKIGSVAMEADAWHHRSDAFSSIGTFIGILGAKLGFAFLDPLTAIIVSVFIIKVGIHLYMQSMDQLVDVAASSTTIEQLEHIALSTEGVCAIHDLKTRLAASKLYVDLEIYVDKNITVEEGHLIATCVHDTIEAQVSDVKHCMVHVEPY